MTLTLIERLEAATGPDRVLECDIYHELGLCNKAQDEICEDYYAPKYTSSIDSAMKLVPDGWYGRVSPRFYSEYDKFEKRIVLWDAYCIRPRWEEASPMNEDYFDVHGNADSHVSAPIALVIAALKARGQK